MKIYCIVDNSIVQNGLYKSWQIFYKKDLELINLNLNYTNILTIKNKDSILNSLYDFIKKDLELVEEYAILAYKEYSFFAYELSALLLGEKIKDPKHLFLLSQKFDSNLINIKDPLDMPLTIFAKRDGDLKLEDLISWRKCTEKECSIKFFDTDSNKVIDYIKESLFI